MIYTHSMRSACQRRANQILVAATGLAVLSGCGRAAKPPSPARPSPGYPITVADARGVAVRLENRPQRIVSAAPVVTEILFAVGAGDRVVAVSDQCDYPPEVRKLPRVGGFFSPSVERVLAAKPDLVIGSRGNPPDFLSAIHSSGCPVFTVDPKMISEIFGAVADIGRVAGCSEGTEQLVNEMHTRLATYIEGTEAVPDERRPTAFIFLQVDPIWTAGAQTFQDDAIRAAGARNTAGNLQGFTAFPAESLIAADPDYLILSTMEGDPQRMAREVIANPIYRQLSAVRGNRIIVLEADQIMRPGPRIVDAVEAMAKAFYPDRFGPADSPSSSATSAR